MSLHNLCVYLFGYLVTGYAVYHLLMKPTLLIDVMQILQKKGNTTINAFVEQYGMRRAYLTALRTTIVFLIIVWPLVVCLKMAEELTVRKN
jgi:hypothetical protein